MKNLFSFILFITISIFGFSQQTSNRIALVIGVQNYTNVPPLRHSLNDANDMAAALKSKGFQVDFLKDPKSKKEMKDAITRYYNTMRSQNEAIGIIYYAGHGTQFEGENYLIPASANIQVPGDMDEQCVKMNTVMSVLNSSNSNLNILLLDACRTNTFPSFSRDIVKGLTNVEAPKGSIVVFATQPGTVASDGTGNNGLFTSKLLKYINEPGLNIGDVLKKVKQDVNTESQGKQLPSVVDNSIGGDFYFTKGASTQVKSVASEITNANSLDYGYGPSDAATVSIGSQVWIAKNLNVDHFVNGDPIPRAGTIAEWIAATNNRTPAWCYYDNDQSIGRTDGKLYNWYAVSDPRGLAPNGWHIPSDREWTTLINFLGGEATAGLSLKSISGWDDKGNGDNRSGFAGIPSGYRVPNGGFLEFGKIAAWWSSSENNIDSAWARDLKYDKAGNVGKLPSGNYKTCGFSVRCIRD